MTVSIVLEIRKVKTQILALIYEIASLDKKNKTDMIVLDVASIVLHIRAPEEDRPLQNQIHSS